MGSSNLQKFVPTDIGTNLLTDAEYLADSGRVSGNKPGVASARLVNKALRQASLMAAGLAEWAAARQAANIDDTLTPAAIAAILNAAQPSAGSRVKGLVGNTVGGAFTTALFTAAEVLLRDATSGASYLFSTVAPPACSISAAGPVINGRDQAAAFGNNTWVHFFFITNGTLVQTLCSLSASAPTLPAGYTASAYIGAVRLGTGTLAAVAFSGAWVLYDNYQTTLTNGAAVVFTAVNVAAFVPPNALGMTINVTDLAITANGSGGYSCSANISAATGANNNQYGIGGVTTAGSNTSAAGWVMNLANQGQQYFYRLVLNSGTAISTSHAVTGYKNPNGGE
ncbi:hypothetical protein D3C87_795950 [compost metagenome]